jgi:hypothetical protein
LLIRSFCFVLRKSKIIFSLRSMKSCVFPWKKGSWYEWIKRSFVDIKWQLYDVKVDWIFCRQMARIQITLKYRQQKWIKKKEKNTFFSLVKQKNKIFNSSQFFTILHNSSQFFTILHNSLWKKRSLKALQALHTCGYLLVSCFLKLTQTRPGVSNSNPSRAAFGGKKYPRA